MGEEFRQDMQTTKAVLVFVAFHPHAEEIANLKACLKEMAENIHYVVVSNDHRNGEPVESLEKDALLFLRNSANTGYGRAMNQAAEAIASLGIQPRYIGALNTDLRWQPGALEKLLNWLDENPHVVMAVPKIQSPSGETQKLCKQNPTVLALLSRRFVPEILKPAWLKRYDRWYTMESRDYETAFSCSYLSGCCMMMRHSSFEIVKGFDEAFFLYLEDADITRRMGALGMTVHAPVSTVLHQWGRGNHYSLRLSLINLHSAWIYFRKWGFRLA
jgi:GT2 family glycosyltransferase